MKNFQRSNGNGHNLPNKSVVVLYNETKELIKGEPQDLIADNGVVLCAKAVVRALQAQGVNAVGVPFEDHVESALAPYSPDKYVVFNLGEGIAGKIFEEARIAWTLEVMGYTFTGNGGDAIAKSTNKALTKSLLKKAGLNTPDWFVFSSAEEVLKTPVKDLRFPLIVKPMAEDGSIGLTNSAVVHTVEELMERVAYVAERYHQLALAESFIDGRELNVALLGNPPQIMPIAEIDFSAIPNPFEKIVSFDAKWAEDSFEYHHTPTVCPARISSSLASRVQKMVAKAWHVIGCSGYARVDLRLDANNVPYIVEVNCNPDISPDAGFQTAARTAGYTYEKLIYKILENAWRRSNDYRQNRSSGARNFNPIDYRENQSLQQNRN